ncbi:hypothetical protein PWG71_09240 [Nocardiopsis sp. N85]|uniref:hypothetical protein n=1 Tax=Nocardiopsis sp. N85 TaxID=3029400 RepID=UPI00237EF163|nr:hypothetical protein [Nocardiopsis sp. N85]MDE3721572.1 hypothetical protein [Nocardiopsis sp. N85]
MSRQLNGELLRRADEALMRQCSRELYEAVYEAVGEPMQWRVVNVSEHVRRRIRGDLV